MKYRGTSVENLIRKFNNSGYIFSSKTYEKIHNCRAIDLDFNYKDVAHLDHVHKDFYCYFHSISEKSIVDTRFIKIFNIKCPVTLSSWEPKKNEHVSLFSLFGFIVITVAKFEDIELNKSKVNNL